MGFFRFFFYHDSGCNDQTVWLSIFLLGMLVSAMLMRRQVVYYIVLVCSLLVGVCNLLLSQIMTAPPGSSTRLCAEDDVLNYLLLPIVIAIALARPLIRRVAAKLRGRVPLMGFLFFLVCFVVVLVVG